VVGPFIQPQNLLMNCKKSIIGIPIITQSDPGTENYGVANAHTVIRQCLNPSLTGTLQHHFAKGHNNILSEIKWSVFRHDFSQVSRICWNKVFNVVGMMWTTFLRSKLRIYLCCHLFLFFHSVYFSVGSQFHGYRLKLITGSCYERYFSSFLLLRHVFALCLLFYLSKHEFTCRSTQVTKHMCSMCLPHGKHTFSSCFTHV
jgi:hypothetical protein